MLFFGHVGITVGAARAANSKFHSAADLRKVAVLAILPDLIDKPIGILYSKHLGNHTRLWGHSLLFSLCFLTALRLAGTKRVRYPTIYWLAFFGHMILDRVWQNSLEFFFWPLLGYPAPLRPDFLSRWYDALFDPYNFLGEVVGLSILAYIFIQSRQARRRTQ